MAKTRRKKTGTPCPVEAYAREVVEGRIVAGQLVRLACQRHLDDLATGAARGLLWDGAAARHALDFFGHLRHSTGEWAHQPFNLQPWQAFVVGSLFGWKRTDGLRRFRTAYVEVARKNGKSVLLAGTALYALVADDEPGAHVYAAATTRDQARIVFGEAERMVDASPALRARVTRTVNNLAVLPTSSWFRPLSADASKMDGLNVHFAAVDEVHEHPNPEIIQKLNTATGARRQPLMFEITTAGHDRHSVCRQHHEFSVKALEGTIPTEASDSWFAYIATIDAGDDWTDPAVWIKANPSLGVTVKIEDLKRQVDEAREMPAQQNAIRRLRLNEWTEQVTRWLDMAVWEEGGPPAATDGGPSSRSWTTLRRCWPGEPASAASTLRGSTTSRPSCCCSRRPAMTIWVRSPTSGSRSAGSGCRRRTSCAAPGATGCPTTSGATRASWWRRPATPPTSPSSSARSSISPRASTCARSPTTAPSPARSSRTCRTRA